MKKKFNMITCYVIDDEFHAVEALCSLIAKVPGLKLIGETTNPLIGLDYITSNWAPDLTFIDIDMPELSGIKLSSLINETTTIVLTTAYRNFALEAFENEVFDYLLKPISQERFLRCITKYKKQSNRCVNLAENKFFYVKGEIKGKLIRININDITYIESALNYIIIHTEGRKQITYLTMGEIQSHLHDNAFSRIHRSFIINNNKIHFISDNDVTLVGNVVLTIGPIYKESFFVKLNAAVIKTKRF